MALWSQATDYLGQLLSFLLVWYSLLWINWLFPISFRSVPCYSTVLPWKCTILQLNVLLHHGLANNIFGIPEISVTPTGSTCENVCQFVLKLSTLQQVTQRTLLQRWSDLGKSFRRCTWHNTNASRRSLFSWTESVYLQSKRHTRRPSMQQQISRANESTANQKLKVNSDPRNKKTKSNVRNLTKAKLTFLPYF